MLQSVYYFFPTHCIPKYEGVEILKFKALWHNIVYRLSAEPNLTNIATHFYQISKASSTFTVNNPYSTQVAHLRVRTQVKK